MLEIDDKLLMRLQFRHKIVKETTALIVIDFLKGSRHSLIIAEHRLPWLPSVTLFSFLCNGDAFAIRFQFVRFQTCYIRICDLFTESCNTNLCEYIYIYIYIYYKLNLMYFC